MVDIANGIFKIYEIFNNTLFLKIILPSSNSPWTIQSNSDHILLPVQESKGVFVSYPRLNHLNNCICSWNLSMKDTPSDKKYLYCDINGCKIYNTFIKKRQNNLKFCNYTYKYKLTNDRISNKTYMTDLLYKFNNSKSSIKNDTELEFDIFNDSNIFNTTMIYLSAYWSYLENSFYPKQCPFTGGYKNKILKPLTFNDFPKKQYIEKIDKSSMNISLDYRYALKPYLSKNLNDNELPSRKLQHSYNKYISLIRKPESPRKCNCIEVSHLDVDNGTLHVNASTKKTVIKLVYSGCVKKEDVFGINICPTLVINKKYTYITTYLKNWSNSFELMQNYPTLFQERRGSLIFIKDKCQILQLPLHKYPLLSDMYITTYHYYKYLPIKNKIYISLRTIGSKTDTELTQDILFLSNGNENISISDELGYIQSFKNIGKSIYLKPRYRLKSGYKTSFTINSDINDFSYTLDEKNNSNTVYKGFYNIKSYFKLIFNLLSYYKSSNIRNISLSRNHLSDKFKSRKPLHINKSKNIMLNYYNCKKKILFSAKERLKRYYKSKKFNLNLYRLEIYSVPIISQLQNTVILNFKLIVSFSPGTKLVGIHSDHCDFWNGEDKIQTLSDLLLKNFNIKSDITRFKKDQIVKIIQILYDTINLIYRKKEKYTTRYIFNKSFNIVESLKHLYICPKNIYKLFMLNDKIEIKKVSNGDQFHIKYLSKTLKKYSYYIDYFYSKTKQSLINLFSIESGIKHHHFNISPKKIQLLNEEFNSGFIRLFMANNMNNCSITKYSLKRRGDIFVSSPAYSIELKPIFTDHSLGEVVNRKVTILAKHNILLEFWTEWAWLILILIIILIGTKLISYILRYYNI